MSVFGLNLMLALAWALLIGQVDRANLLVGFVIAYLVLWLVRPALGDTRYFTRLPRVVGFAAFLLAELVLSSLRVARAVLSPSCDHRPGIVAVPLEPASELEVAVLANLVTLTPGTVSLDVTEDRSHLLVHTMFFDDADSLIASIKSDFERRVLELLR